MDHRTAAVAAELGFTPAWLHQLRQTPFPQVTQTLEDFKVEAKRRFKKLALKYHPDHNPGDPEAEARFKLLTPLLQQIQDLRIQPRPIVQRRVVWQGPPVNPIHFQSTGTDSATYTTTSYFARAQQTTTGPTYDATRVVFIRVT